MGKVKNTFIVLISILISVLLAEGLSQIYLKLTPSFVSRWDFRNSFPQPYSDDGIYTKEFILESMQCVRDIETALDGNHFRQGDFSGKYINIKNGIRLTTDHQAGVRNQIYLFGGSTVFNQEVPDDHTIASYLQRILNLNSKDFNVINYGVVSFTISQQTSLLKTLNIESGDIIIFYDGANDIAYPLERNMPAGWMPGDNHEARVVSGIKKLSVFEKLITQLHFKFPNIGFFEIIYSKLNQPALVGLESSEEVFKSNLESMKKNFVSSLKKANEVSKQNGARFFHFLQPTIFSLSKKSDYEKFVIANDYLARTSSEISYAKGYSGLQNALNQLAKVEEIELFDLTKILDYRNPGEEFFLDYVHVNHRANERIATSIYSAIFEKNRP